jgi:hypothetical protein
MNCVLYKYLIEPWIAIKDRPILERRNLWLIGAKRLYKSKNYHLLMAEICIHHGICDKRYCTCKYFSAIDKRDCYDRIFRSYIKII